MSNQENNHNEVFPDGFNYLFIVCLKFKYFIILTSVFSFLLGYFYVSPKINNYYYKTMVEVLPINNSNVRTIFQKAGGSLGTQGSASHNFNQLGVIKIDKNEMIDEDILELAIEAGADECKTNNDYHEIQCQMNEIYNVKKELEKKITNFISTEIEWIPLNRVKISSEKNEDLINFFETLEEEDDVQNIYSNAEFAK